MLVWLFPLLDQRVVSLGSAEIGFSAEGPIFLCCLVLFLTLSAGGDALYGTILVYISGLDWVRLRIHFTFYQQLKGKQAIEYTFYNWA